MRMDYEVRKLPDSYVTEEIEYAFEDVPNGRANRWGEKPQRMVPKKKEVRGGWLVVVRGKPGHSIRIQSLEQALDLKLIDHDEYVRMSNLGELRPRLIDTTTGERVNEQGIPLHIADELANGTHMPKGAARTPMGGVETDIDVNSNGNEDIAGDEVPNDVLTTSMKGHEHVAAQIDETE